MKLNFRNTYQKLPESFYQKGSPAKFPNPTLIKFNKSLAEQLLIDCIDTSDIRLAEFFSGNKLIVGAEPIAQAYSGHQFGHFNPSLGDGRALLLGDVEDLQRKLMDIQLKGSGVTAFSRRGDGKSALGPVIREYILSEAMFNLGVPTTRALAAVRTGEDVVREDVLPGGVFTRVSASHIRVGTFEYFSSREMLDELKQLTHYSIKRLYPELLDVENSHFLFLKEISKKKLDLVAKWMGLGFIHGVMNTDNTSIAGLTIDYGPCAFMDKYSRDKVFSSIDRQGRYAYSNQGKIALWNLSMLANSLYPVLRVDGESDEELIQRLQKLFSELELYYENSYQEEMRKKFGFLENSDESKIFIANFLKHMEQEKLDFTNTFYDLRNLKFPNAELEENWKNLLTGDQADAVKLMEKANPFIIPRNHQVEKAIQQSVVGDDSHFHYLVEAYSHPFEYNESYLELTKSPAPSEVVYQTFCGT